MFPLNTGNSPCNKPACEAAAKQACCGQRNRAGDRPAAEAKVARLLLIEDEETLAKNIASFFAHGGWDVEIAGSAEAGLERAAALAPDVIVLDFTLPCMDGLAALSILRQREPRARIVMLSAQASIKLAVDAMKAGAADFLAKPVSLARLKGVLDKVVPEARLRNQPPGFRGSLFGACG